MRGKRRRCLGWDLSGEGAFRLADSLRSLPAGNRHLTFRCGIAMGKDAPRAAFILPFPG